MTNIILSVEKPDLSFVENEQEWKRCIDSLSALTRQNKEIRLLGENVLLIPLNEALNGLAKVVSVIGKLGYSYLILNEDIELREVAKRA